VLGAIGDQYGLDLCQYLLCKRFGGLAGLFRIAPGDDHQDTLVRAYPVTFRQLDHLQPGSIRLAVGEGLDILLNQSGAILGGQFTSQAIRDNK
jgi:hypothetical protein